MSHGQENVQQETAEIIRLTRRRVVNRNDWDKALHVGEQKGIHRCIREGPEMVRHHRLRGREFEQTPVDGEGQGSLVCGSPWGRQESDNRVTEQQDLCYSWSLKSNMYC